MLARGSGSFQAVKILCTSHAAAAHHAEQRSKRGNLAANVPDDSVPYLVYRQTVCRELARELGYTPETAHTMSLEDRGKVLSLYRQHLCAGPANYLDLWRATNEDALRANAKAGSKTAAALRDPTLVDLMSQVGAIGFFADLRSLLEGIRVENTTAAQLQEAFDLHVSTPLAFARSCAGAMKERGSGCLLQLASTAGLRGYPYTSAYTAAKHGMIGLSRALHAELGPKAIQVYAVCPGFVDSDITRGAAAAIADKGHTTAEAAHDLMGQQNRIGRMHTCEEVAAEVALLLRERPDGCVYELDRDPPAFLD